MVKPHLATILGHLHDTIPQLITQSETRIIAQLPGTQQTAKPPARPSAVRLKMLAMQDALGAKNILKGVQRLFEAALIPDFSIERIVSVKRVQREIPYSIVVRVSDADTAANIVENAKLFTFEKGNENMQEILSMNNKVLYAAYSDKIAAGRRVPDYIKLKKANFEIQLEIPWDQRSGRGAAAAAPPPPPPPDDGASALNSMFAASPEGIQRLIGIAPCPACACALSRLWGEVTTPIPLPADFFP